MKVVELLMEKKSSFEILQKNKIPLTKEEKAQMVLIWAQAPDLDAHALALRLEQEIGKRVTATLVEQELEHLGLISPAGEADHDEN